MRKIAKWIISAAVWLLLWTAAAAAVGRELLLPSPLAVVRSLGALMGTEEFWYSLMVTFGRVLTGFALGSILGMAFAGLTTLFQWGDLVFSPALRAVRTVPVVSFILLLYFCLPTGQVPTVVSALMVLPVVWRAAGQGLSAADPKLLELCRAYHMGRWKTFRLVRFPQALPALCAGWETGLGLAWKSNLAAEVLCQPKWSVGSGLQSAKSTLDTAGVAAWTAAVVVLSLLVEALFRLLLHRWRGGAAI